MGGKLMGQRLWEWITGWELGGHYYCYCYCYYYYYYTTTAITVIGPVERGTVVSLHGIPGGISHGGHGVSKEG